MLAGTKVRGHFEGLVLGTGISTNENFTETTFETYLKCEILKMLRPPFLPPAILHCQLPGIGIDTNKNFCGTYCYKRNTFEMHI